MRGCKRQQAWRRAALAGAMLVAACRPSGPPVDRGGDAGAASMISVEPWGEAEGRDASLYILRNRNGLEARVTDFGANLVEMWVPDRDGTMADVVLGFDSLAGYLDNGPNFGSTVGRVANRIAFGRFDLDGRTYQLATNNGPHHLHGGLRGFNKVLWQATPAEGEDGPSLTLRYTSPDGEEGYPGTLSTTVVYTLMHDDELRVEMSATTDAPTLVNLAHHSYWNLAGHDSGNVREHTLQIHAARYTPGDEGLIPTGAIEPVAGTPFDFTSLRRLGDSLDALASWRDREPGGFDENLVVDGEPGELRPVATLRDPASGRSLELLANQPGVQLYTANFLAGTPGKGGAVYERHQAVCLETQVFPDAVHHLGEPGWPSPVLRPGERYYHLMVHRFRAR